MILDIKGISKSFNKKNVLKNISFSIQKGEIIGLIGPNGSGKTTLLNILIKNIKPTSGSFYIKEGIKLGMAISRKGFFDDMSVIENIKMYSSVTGRDLFEVQQLLKYFSIDYGEVRFGSLSAGMKQKLSLVLAFNPTKKIIILDEPTNHLDIDSILNLRSLILKAKKSETSFLITSHTFSDLEKICDRIIFLRDGFIVSDSSTHQLINQYNDLEKAYLEILKGHLQ